MALVAGIDFGTLSVRVSLVDHARGRLGTATESYPLTRRKDDPDHATQRHADQLCALEKAMRAALAAAAVDGREVAALAVATTGSTIIPVDAQREPLDDYYLWCDHRSHREAAEITGAARRAGLPALEWSGGEYSSEMGLAKLLHWLRRNPQSRPRLAAVLENCDLIVATLTGCRDVQALPRSVCAMGHKWLWSERLGGLPSREFLASVDPLLADAHRWLAGRYGKSDQLAGTLAGEWAERLGLRAGIPIPFAALDAHWDAIGAGITEGDVVNVVGTSTCIMAVVAEPTPIPGVCGVVDGSIHPHYAGIEAGLSAAGDVFEAIARRAGRSVGELSRGLASMRPGQSGLLRLVWDNGDRTVLTNPALGGVTFGWNLTHSAEDELLAAIEGTAFHTRIVFERLMKHGVPIRRVINSGGIPQRNEALNQIYADVFNMPVLVPASEITSLGSAIFAFLAAGVFPNVAEAQRALSPGYRTIAPRPDGVARYERLYTLFRDLYFSLGSPDSAPMAAGAVLPELRRIAAEALGDHSER